MLLKINTCICNISMQTNKLDVFDTARSVAAVVSLQERETES